ncbi:MAG: flagellar basal body rod protein FlgC [Rhodocyclaceae bacterium]
MDYEQIFAISAAGMAAEKTRVQVAALNIANAQTVAVNGSGAYQPLKVIARVVAAPVFGSLVDTALAMRPLVDVVPDEVPPRQVYDPSHPLASKDGFLNYPGVDNIGEMVRLMSATRAYEGNVVAFNTIKSLAIKTLEIGGA